MSADEVFVLVLVIVCVLVVGGAAIRSRRHQHASAVQGEAGPSSASRGEAPEAAAASDVQSPPIDRSKRRRKG